MEKAVTRWALPVACGMFGAALPSIAAELLYLTDEGGWQLPGRLSALVFGVWIGLALPGAWVPGPAVAKLIVASVFWGGVMLWTVRTWQTRRRRHRPSE